MLPILSLIAGTTFATQVALMDSMVAPRPAPLVQPPQTSAEIREYVSAYFSDAPIMADIAWCESRFRHLGPDGKIFRGVVNDRDIGVMQINTDFHAETADKLGIDIHSFHGNLEYARYLYEREGTRPWNSSRPCWGKLAFAQ